MAAIYHNGDWYGLGSDVVANPQDSATDTLTKVGIDGTVYEVTDADAVHTSDIGTANGVAELDANGLVPSSQLPSYVDDVLEYANVSAFPATGETGKIYVALDTNLTYRWSGSAYVEISPSLALGETSSTAYRGDRGKTAYDHATESGRSGAKSAGLYKIGVTAQGHIASATPVAKSDLTALGVADQNDVDAIEEDIEGYKTVTGKYITITDGAELPAESYSLTLSPVQEGSGDPSPSNVRPIHGADEVGVRVCGVNLWDEEWENGYIGSSGALSPDPDSIRSKNFIPVIGSETYYCKCPKAVQIIYYDTNESILTRGGVQNGTFTTPSNCVKIKFYMSNTQSYGNDISINHPSTDTTYHAFNGHSTTITLPSTVYGGSVDMGGNGQVTFGLIDLSTQSTWYSDSLNAYGFIRYIAPISGKKSGYNMYCSSFKVSDTVIPSTATEEAVSGYGENNNIYLAINSNRLTGDLTTADGRKAALLTWLQNNTVTVAYELATPTDISVTPFPQTLLEGVNNVWAEMVENSIVIDNAQQSLSYQPQNIVGELRQEINQCLSKDRIVNKTIACAALIIIMSTSDKYVSARFSEPVPQNTIHIVQAVKVTVYNGTEEYPFILNDVYYEYVNDTRLLNCSGFICNKGTTISGTFVGTFYVTEIS